MTTPAQEDEGMSVDFVGPFERTEVVVDGWSVPLLSARLLDDETVNLTVDDRLTCNLPYAQARKVVWFIANSIAIAQGLSCHPSGGGETSLPGYNPLHPRRLAQIGTVEIEEATP